MVNDTLLSEQVNPKQAIIAFKKLISVLKHQSQQIIQETDSAAKQIIYFENNIKLIKSSKYYRFLNFIKNIFKS